MSELMRKTTLSCAIVLVLTGTILSIAAILTPSWQVVNLQEYNSVHEHGLWLDCTRHVRDGHALLRRYTTISEPLHCVYKFDYDKYSGTFDLEDDNSPVGEVNRHKFYGWHTATMILLTLALLTSLLSLCIAACGCCYASLSIVFTISTLLTSFLSNVALGIFFFFSHRADNRFIKGIVATYEQRVGLAFFLQMAACAVHFFALGVAAVSTYFAFTVKGGALDRYSIQNSSKTNMTNVGRSAATESASEAQRRLVSAALSKSHIASDSSHSQSVIFEDDGTVAAAPTYYGNNGNTGRSASAMMGVGHQSEAFPLLEQHKAAERASLRSTSLLDPHSHTQSSVTVFDAAPRQNDSFQENGGISNYEREPYNYTTRRQLDSTAPNTSVVEEVVERRRHEIESTTSTYR